MKRTNLGIAPIILLIVLVLASAIVIVPFINSLDSEPAVSLSASISPLDPIKEEESASLTLKFKNQDMNSHNISVVIDVLPRVSVYSGTTLLSDKKYTFTIDSGDPDETRVLTAKGFLEEGVSSAKYDINLKLYVDGIEIPQEAEKLELTVES